MREVCGNIIDNSLVITIADIQKSCGEWILSRLVANAYEQVRILNSAMYLMQESLHPICYFLLISKTCFESLLIIFADLPISMDVFSAL